jgi:hypothetical protein
MCRSFAPIILIAAFAVSGCGQNGDKGEKGDPGLAGPAGPQGPPGPPGSDGTNAAVQPQFRVVRSSLEGRPVKPATCGPDENDGRRDLRSASGEFERGSDDHRRQGCNLQAAVAKGGIGPGRHSLRKAVDFPRTSPMAMLDRETIWGRWSIAAAGLNRYDVLLLPRDDRSCLRGG